MKQQILVIDSNKAIRFLLQTVFGKKYQVITAADGYSAMQWLAKRNRPDLIIADPQLPGLQDWELVEHIASSGLYGNIPVIILSAISKSEMQSKCDELGITACFPKPFNPIELGQAIERLTTTSIPVTEASRRLTVA